MQTKKTYDDFSIDALMAMDPEYLMTLIADKFKLDIPISIDTPEDMVLAGSLLGRCTSNYSYLVNMSMMAKIMKRKLKRAGADKNTIEDALSREEIFTNYADIMKAAYNTVSRMITVKQQINAELKMSDSK